MQPTESPPETQGETHQDAAAPEAPQEPSPLSALARDFAEMAEYFSCYVSATFDRGKLSIKELLWAAVGWASGVIVVSGVLLTAVVFLFYGAALGLAGLFGNRLWLGCLLSGLFFLTLTAGLIRFQRARFKRASLKKRVQKYEQTLDEQREKFGRDLEDQAVPQE